MAPGFENGAGVETPEPVVPTRIAGRCDLRWQPKRRHRFFLHRNRTPSPLCPNGFSSFAAPALTRPKNANVGFWGTGWGWDATEAGKPPQTVSQGRTAGNGGGRASCCFRHHATRTFPARHTGSYPLPSAGRCTPPEPVLSAAGSSPPSSAGELPSQRR